METPKRRPGRPRLAWKVCPGCGTEKPRADFYERRTAAGVGISARCRTCQGGDTARWRRETLEIYGAWCACCGESELAFLTLDHVNGDGAAERRTANGTRGSNGHIFRRIARSRRRDPRYQVLCWNCNLAKHQLGRCPHQGKP